MINDLDSFEEDEEETMGVHTGMHASGVELEEGLNTSTQRNLCANCRRNVHCYVKIDKKTREAIVHKTCKSSDCECRCRTHYSCRHCGYLHPYGQKCNRIEAERVKDPKADASFDKLMSGWKKQDDKKKTIIPKKKIK